MNLLSIAGSDPSSGAGIQSDIKTFFSLGEYGLTVVTSITSQNTKKFVKVEPISSKMIRNQLDVIFSDFKIDAIKIGMVYSSPIIKAIYSKLSNIKVPIILDPVIKSSTGGELLKKESFDAYKSFLIPLAYVITPNASEASSITGMTIKNKQDLRKCAIKIKKIGASNVVITGISFQKDKISDFVLGDSKHYIISSPKLKHVNHGSGCNFSASLCVAISRGKNLLDAVRFAKKYTYNSIKNSKKIGKGLSITYHEAKSQNDKIILENAITDFKKLKKIYTLIPECQTNFVYSKKNIRTIKDVLGVSGRIVKVGKDIVVAGGIIYGGSRHVGSAVFEINKKFPQIRSAVNVKYDPNLINQWKKKSFTVKSYNRTNEPNRLKKKENSSISWGIKQAIKNAKIPPDIIFHRGDFGKEPMTLIFGKTPSEVVEKVSKIL